VKIVLERENNRARHVLNRSSLTINLNVLKHARVANMAKQKLVRAKFAHGAKPGILWRAGALAVTIQPARRSKYVWGALE
jgi:hypothetical protein